MKSYYKTTRKESSREKTLGDWITRTMNGKYLKQTSEDGIPDRLIILPGGCYIFLELKTEKGVVSSAQQEQYNRLTGMGCQVIIDHDVERIKRTVVHLYSKFCGL